MRNIPRQTRAMRMREKDKAHLKHGCIVVLTNLCQSSQLEFPLIRGVDRRPGRSPRSITGVVRAPGGVAPPRNIPDIPSSAPCQERRSLAEIVIERRGRDTSGHLPVERYGGAGPRAAGAGA